MRSKWLWAVAATALLPGWALAQTGISVENNGVVTRPVATGQVLPETHNVHTILWTDSKGAASYNVYVSDKAITDVGAPNVYRIGTEIPEGQQAYEYALLTPFAPGAVTNFYAVTSVSSAGAENTKVTAGANATTAGTKGTAEWGQAIFWFLDEPFIDAEFDDWPAEVLLFLTPDDPWYRNGITSGPNDQSGKVAMGITGTDLFFMGEVADDVLANTAPNSGPESGAMWAGDNIEYYIGFYDLRPSELRHPAAQWGNATDPTKAEPDWQLDIAGNAFDDPNRSQNYCAGVCAPYQVPMGAYGLEVLTKETAKGWNLEARLPFVGMAQDPAVIAPFRPKIGMILPTTIALADGDDPNGGRENQMFWAKDAAANNAWNTPSAWENEQVIYDPKVFGLGGGATAVEATSWGQIKADFDK